MKYVSELIVELSEKLTKETRNEMKYGERLIYVTINITSEKNLERKIDRRWNDRGKIRSNKTEKDMVEKIKDNNFYL